LILVGIGLMHFLVLDKLPFLNLYYLPVVLAAWGCGRRTALLISLLSVLLVVLYAVAAPSNFDEDLAENLEEIKNLKAGGAPRAQVAVIENEIADQKLNIHLSLAAWGSFLILVAALVGTLYDQRERKANELRQAYMGILEILTKCLECADRDVLSHSQRVAELVAEIARELELPENAVEKVRMGGLLHDMENLDIWTRALLKSPAISEEEHKEVGIYRAKGTEILRSAEVAMPDIIRMVKLHRQYHLGPRAEIPDVLPGKLDRELRLSIGTIAVADSYDTTVSDRPHRPGKTPWQAVRDIDARSGTQFHREVVEAFKRVISRKI